MSAASTGTWTARSLWDVMTLCMLQQFHLLLCTCIRLLSILLPIPSQPPLLSPSSSQWKAPRLRLVNRNSNWLMEVPTTLATHPCVVQYGYRDSSMLAVSSLFCSARLVETGAAYTTATADHRLLVHVLPYARLCMQVIFRACCAEASEPLIPTTCIILYRDFDVHSNVAPWWLYSHTSWYERESLRFNCRFENEVGAWRVRNGKCIDHVFATRV